MEQRKRARTTAAAVAQAPAAAKAADRPSDVEQRAAQRVLNICKEVKLEPPLVAPSTRPDTKVIALALALYFGEKFESEAKAKEAFGVGASTNVRKLWVEDKLVRLFEHRPAAKQAAAIYFYPTPTTANDDDILWNEAPAPATASHASTEPPCTALEVLPTTSSASEVMATEASDDEYERGFRDGKQVRANEQARDREIALMREIRELRGAVSLLHTDLKAATMCVRHQAIDRHFNEAELRYTKETLEAKEKAMHKIEWPPDFFGQDENFQCWMSFCDAYRDADHYLARFMKFCREDTEPAAEEDAKQLMAKWEPDLQLLGHELYDRLRARARASFDETESEAEYSAAMEVECKFSGECDR